MSHHENAYFVDTQLITCHAIYIPLIPAFHTTPMPTRQTPLTARSQQLSKHLRSSCRSICAAPAEASVQQLPKHLSSTCRTTCAAPAEAPEQQLPKHLRSTCRSTCAAPAEAPVEASVQNLPRNPTALAIELDKKQNENGKFTSP